MSVSADRTKMLIMGMRVVGGLAGAAIVGIALWQLITTDRDIKSVVNDLYRIVFGTLIVIAEFRWTSLLVWFSFMVHFIGLGGWYIFVGGLALSSNWWDIVMAIILCAIGIFYCGLGCCCRSMEDDVMPDVEAAKPGSLAPSEEPLSQV